MRPSLEDDNCDLGSSTFTRSSLSAEQLAAMPFKLLTIQSTLIELLNIFPLVSYQMARKEPRGDPGVISKSLVRASCNGSNMWWKVEIPGVVVYQVFWSIKSLIVCTGESRGEGNKLVRPILSQSMSSLDSSGTVIVPIAAW